MTNRRRFSAKKNCCARARSSGESISTKSTAFASRRSSEKRQRCASPLAKANSSRGTLHAGARAAAGSSSLQNGVAHAFVATLVAAEFAVVELEHPIGEMEVMVVMGNYEHGLAARFEFGEQLHVEKFLEERVLIGRPLVEDVERPVLEIRGEQREAL